MMVNWKAIVHGHRAVDDKIKINQQCHSICFGDITVIYKGSNM